MHSELPQREQSKKLQKQLIIQFAEKITTAASKSTCAAPSKLTMSAEIDLIAIQPTKIPKDISQRQPIVDELQLF